MKQRPTFRSILALNIGLLTGQIGLFNSAAKAQETRRQCTEDDVIEALCGTDRKPIANVRDRTGIGLPLQKLEGDFRKKPDAAVRDEEKDYFQRYKDMTAQVKTRYDIAFGSVTPSTIASRWNSSFLFARTPEEFRQTLELRKRQKTYDYFDASDLEGWANNWAKKLRNNGYPENEIPKAIIEDQRKYQEMVDNNIRETSRGRYQSFGDKLRNEATPIYFSIDDRTIVYLPYALLANPHYSKAALFFLTAHEVAHHFEQYIREKTLPAVSCFRAHYPTNDLPVDEERDNHMQEIFTDWLASIPADSWVSTYPDADKLPLAQNMVADLCEEREAVPAVTDLRIMARVRQPGLLRPILDSLKCGSLVNDGNKPLVACNLRGQTYTYNRRTSPAPSAQMISGSGR
ncbi:MAG TPA: hypothetical protein VI895_08465 [Bdellovibrionota bacterium]|nr:hypothetical protein [Bdellovibrionota bacterium]